MNDKLLTLFSEIRAIAEMLGEEYKAKAYRIAINEIKKLNFTINKDTLDIISKQKIKGVGKGIMSKIEEFVNTGNIDELSQLKSSPQVVAHSNFSKILGVGPATINEWIKMGLLSLTDLRRAISAGNIKLNRMQQMGLLYYDDLNQRIPRDEVTQLGSIFYKYITTMGSNIVFEIAGSYRRGSLTCGDIDIIISDKKQFNQDLIPGFITMIAEDPNYVDSISAGTERVSFLYKSPISRKVRQIDILNIKYESFFAALNYFTGGYIHNEWLRGVAKKKGYRLNQNGLFKQTGSTLKLIKINSEKDIYVTLGVDYIPPKQRQ